ncbi:MAG: hypothetical protein MUO76_10955 [Anaerolineaceae bacterium]|nr:hypothetical protein [Anaerolineaceae bacterium]
MPHKEAAMAEGAIGKERDADKTLITVCQAHYMTAEGEFACVYGWIVQGTVKCCL